MEVLLILGIVAIAGFGFHKWQQSEHAKTIRAAQSAEANAFINNLAETQTLPEIAVDIVLKKGKKGLLQEPSRLMETRAVRHTGAMGTRIGKIYVGGARSESHQEYRRIDQGTLVLTTQRLVFDATSQSGATNIADVLSASAWPDAIEVSSSKRQKSQVYAVGNPMIWATMIDD